MNTPSETTGPEVDFYLDFHRELKKDAALKAGFEQNKLAQFENGTAGSAIYILVSPKKVLQLVKQSKGAAVTHKTYKYGSD